jgi:hypothetical protein
MKRGASEIDTHSEHLIPSLVDRLVYIISHSVSDEFGLGLVLSQPFVWGAKTTRLPDELQDRVRSKWHKHKRNRKRVCRSTLTFKGASVQIQYYKQRYLVDSHGILQGTLSMVEKTHTTPLLFEDKKEGHALMNLCFEQGAEPAGLEATQSKAHVHPRFIIS